MIADGYRLEELAPDHAPALAAAYLRNRVHLAPWDPVRSERFFTEVGQREEVDARVRVVDAGHGVSWVLLREQQVVGRVNLNNVVRGVFQSCHLGYWVDEAHTGRGLASAMVEHAAAYAGRIGLHRVEAGTLPANGASQAVLRRCGFTEVGHAAAYLFIAGAWRDHLLFQRILHDRGLGPPASRPRCTMEA